MRRIISIIMTVMLTAMMMTACGESGSGNKQESVTEAAAAAENDLFNMKSYENDEVFDFK